MTTETLIPPPPVVREHLKQSLERTRLLRRLLRLSERDAEQRHRTSAPRQTPERREAAHA